jgi:putative photosynthetic complex assembly protein 2
VIELVAPILFATAIWFVATGAVLWLDRRSPATWPASLLAATVVAGFATAAVLVTAPLDTPLAAHVAFVAAILVWGWHEMAFLMGFVTGPRRAPEPAGARGWRRFRFATATLIHHEIALALTALLLFLATWGQPNLVAPYAFLLLFALRLSAKFNIFVGVPHLADDMLPPHLHYLATYFRRRRAGPLLMASTVLVLGTTLALGAAALAAPAGSGLRAAYQLLAALAALGLLEHLFLVLPWRETALWGWAMKTAYPKGSG